MKTHFTSDTHFGHGKAAEFRGFDNVDQMNDSMIGDWNDRVGPEDDVYHLGDFSFYGSKKTREIIEVLKGRIHLVPGNHDASLNAKTLSMFHRVLPPVYDLKIPVHSEDGGTVESFHRFALCHFPLLSWNRMHHRAMHLHGHSHGTCKYPQPNNRIMDVGVDPFSRQLFHEVGQQVFAPISLEQVLAVMSTRSFSSPDQHTEKTP